VADLAERARGNRLTREEITGGTFTVSNLGMFGVDRFDAIINPPQVAILAVGAGQDRVVAREGQPAVRRMVTLTPSCDHRVVDGAMGAKFLATLRELLEAAKSL
jgi:pyruvate dehydrogenase E2 component (dihydrolipoamide acetyltransferase)